MKTLPFSDIGQSSKHNNKDWDPGSLTCAQVGGTAVDVAVLLILHEGVTRLLLHGVLHGLDTFGQALEHSLHVATLLHGDDAELVLLVDPGLGRLV